jgi:hypothetical protein
MIIVIVIITTITNASNSLEIKKKNVCIYKDVAYVTMRNMTVMIVI